tara:strand:+ start:17 stop:445 length:429 start_codon:yes stop_codon:yes gene_type:complete
MFGLIIFAFKIVFSVIIGALISYSPKSKLFKDEIFKSSLLCLFGSSITGTLVQYNNNLSLGIVVLGILITIVSLTQNEKFTKRIIWIFCGLIGAIIGLGFIFRALLLLTLLYYIIWHKKNIFEYLEVNTEQIEDESLKNVSN